MTTAQTILSNHPGPLPINVQYTPESDESVTLMFTGSVQSHNMISTQVGITLKVNGEAVGHSLIKSHSSDKYRFTTVPAMVDTVLPFNTKGGKVEPVTIELSAYTPDSNTDAEDLFNLCIIR